MTLSPLRAILKTGTRSLIRHQSLSPESKLLVFRAFAHFGSRFACLCPNFCSIARPTLPMKSELDVYRDCVEQLMSARSPKPISNGMPAHAAVLFETFFKNAKSSVKIFCRKLDNRVFDDPRVFGAAADAIKRDISFDVVVQEKSEPSGFYNLLATLHNDPRFKVDFRDSAGEASPILGEVTQNFAVMDCESYRFEPSNSDVTATACMYDPAIASQLSRIFTLVRSHLPPKVQHA